LAYVSVFLVISGVRMRVNAYLLHERRVPIVHL